MYACPARYQGTESRKWPLAATALLRPYGEGGEPEALLDPPSHLYASPGS